MGRTRLVSRLANWWAKWQLVRAKAGAVELWGEFEYMFLGLRIKIGLTSITQIATLLST